MNEANYNIRVSDTVESRVYKGRTISWTVYTITGKDFMRMFKPTIDLFKMNNKGLNWANDDEKVSIFVYPGTRIVVKFWDPKYIPEFVSLIAKERVISKEKPPVMVMRQEEAINELYNNGKWTRVDSGTIREITEADFKKLIHTLHLERQTTQSWGPKPGAVGPARYIIVEENMKPWGDRKPALPFCVFTYAHEGNSQDTAEAMKIFSVVDEIIHGGSYVEKHPVMVMRQEEELMDGPTGTWVHSPFRGGIEMAITMPQLLFLANYKAMFDFRKIGFSEYDFVWSGDDAMLGGDVQLGWTGGKGSPKVYVTMYGKKEIAKYKRKIDLALTRYKVAPIVKPPVMVMRQEEALVWDRGLENSGTEKFQDAFTMTTELPQTEDFIKELKKTFNLVSDNKYFAPKGGFTDSDVLAEPLTKPLISLQLRPKYGLPYKVYRIYVYRHDTSTVKKVEALYNKYYTKHVMVMRQEESRLSRILERANPNTKYFFSSDLSESFCQKILLHEGILTKSSDFLKDSTIPGVKVFREVWNTDGYPEDCPDVSLTVYRNEAGDMVCTEDESSLIKFFTKHGISPTKSKSCHSVCSIGFSEKEQKWYGWSHRAACGFGIGDKVFEQKFGTEDTLFTKHGEVTIENMAQARQAAVAFANYVS